MNKIDRFFKKKLGDLQLDPTSSAWAKLETNISKKNKGIVWFRAAAALLLMGLSIAAIVLLRNGEENQQLVEGMKSISTTVPGVSEIKADSSNILAPSQPNKLNVAKRKSNSKKEKITEPSTIQSIEQVNNIETLKIKTFSAEAVAKVVNQEKPIVIEFTLETILPHKKETFVTAEASEKKNSLQKALDFARDAKNSDLPVGGLRQAKDDLFALNFIKDKQKKQ
ncbi:MAG: hypothetical protein JJE09_14835 [Bacteroidia bacterium]|nr:hypothetical protein [Bacteroidia bacterium]